MPAPNVDGFNAGPNISKFAPSGYVPVMYDVATGEFVIQSAEVSLSISGGGFLGSEISYASPAGTSGSVNPGSGFPGTSGAPVGCINVTLSSGTATWTSLAAGLANQLLWITNADPSNTLTLNEGGAGSEPFTFVGDLAIPPGGSALLRYSESLTSWVIL